MEYFDGIKPRALIWAYLIIFFILAFSASAQNDDVPIGLKRIIDFNKQSTIDFAVKVSFFIAFIAGTLGVLSPCILPFLPAYFSYTFKEKKNITWMTLVFFLGFSIVFITMGVIAGFLGEQSLAVMQKGWLVAIAGAFMIILGIISLRGKTVCSYFKLGNKWGNDFLGTFLFGIFFAVGWTACLGPILAGILGIGAILGNIWNSALLLFFYSLGNFLPLFVLSIFYDKLNLSKSKFIQGKILTFSFGKRKVYMHSTNLISGVLFIIIGIVLLVYNGTSVINRTDIFGTKAYFYSLQRQLIEWRYANIFGAAAFFLFFIILGWALLRHKYKK